MPWPNTQLLWQLPAKRWLGSYPQHTTAVLLAGVLMPVMLELAQTQVVCDLGRQREQPSEAAGPDSLESNSCSGKCPLLHNSLQKGLVTSGTWSSSIPVCQLPELQSTHVSATTVSREPEKDLLNTLGSTSVLLLQGSPVPMYCLCLLYSRSGFVPARGAQHDKMTVCSPTNTQLWQRWEILAHILICSMKRNQNESKWLNIL